MGTKWPDISIEAHKEISKLNLMIGGITHAWVRLFAEFTWGSVLL